jgi:hypothetical protein
MGTGSGYYRFEPGKGIIFVQFCRGGFFGK